MSNDQIQPELSNGYRSSRRNLALLAAVGLAWSVAQFEIGSLSIGGLTIDLSSASIPISLSVVLVYLIYRMIFEYSMQKIIVRRWRLAQLDFRIIYGLARISLVLLAASTLYRSIFTMFMVVLGIFVFAMAHYVATVSLTLLAMPFLLWIKAKKSNHPSVAMSAIESVVVAEVIAAIIFTTAIACTTFYLLQKSNLFDSNKHTISTGSTIHIALVTVVIYYSFLLREKLESWLFKEPSVFDEI